MKVSKDCMPLLHEKRDKKIAKEACTETTVSSGSRLSVSEAVLYRKNASAVLRKQMAVLSSQDVFFILQDVPEVTKHSVSRCSTDKSRTLI